MSDNKEMEVVIGPSQPSRGPTYAEKGRDIMNVAKVPNQRSKKQERKREPERKSRGLPDAEAAKPKMTGTIITQLPEGKRRKLNPSKIDGKHQEGYFSIPIPGRQSWAAFHIESEAKYVLGVNEFILSIPVTNSIVEITDALIFGFHELAAKHHWTEDTRIQLDLEGNSLDDDGNVGRYWAFKAGSLNDESAKWKNFKLAPVMELYLAQCDNNAQERYHPVFLHRARIIAITPPAGGCGGPTTEKQSKFVGNVLAPEGDLACGWRAIALGWWLYQHRKHMDFEKEWRKLVRKDGESHLARTKLMDKFINEFQLDLQPERTNVTHKVYKRVCTYEDMQEMASKLTTKLNVQGTEVRIRVFNGENQPVTQVMTTRSCDEAVERWDDISQEMTTVEREDLMDRCRSPIFTFHGEEDDAEALSAYLQAKEVNMQTVYINLVRRSTECKVPGVEYHYDLLKPEGVGKFVYNTDKFCDKCNLPYTNTRHKCNWTCPACRQETCSGKARAQETMQCADCRRMFYGSDCFKSHKHQPADGSESLCRSIYQCSPYRGELTTDICRKCPRRHFYMTHYDARQTAKEAGGTMRPWWIVPEGMAVEAFIAEKKFPDEVAEGVRKNFYTPKEQKEYKPHVHNTFRCDTCYELGKDTNQPFGHVHHIGRVRTKKNKKGEVLEEERVDVRTILYLDAETEKDEKGKERVNCFVIGGHDYAKGGEKSEIKMLSTEEDINKSLEWMLYTRPKEIYEANAKAYKEFQKADRKSKKTLARFIKENKLTSIKETTAIAHNGSRFDFQLVIQSFFKSKELQRGYVLQTPIRNGNRIISMRFVPRGEGETGVVRNKKKMKYRGKQDEPEHGVIRFLDSFMHWTKSLKDFGKAMKVECGDKDYFPHAMRKTSEDQYSMDYVGPVPPIKYFEPWNYKKKGDFEDFMSWNDKEKKSGTVWNLRAINKTYCQQDVRILGQAWERYVEEMLRDPVKLDPTKSPTLPSFCKKILLRRFLPKDKFLPVHVGELGKWMRRCLRGGRTEIYGMMHHINEPSEKHNISRSDARSLYPSVMIRNLYPCAGGTHFKGDEVPDRHTVESWIRNDKQIVFAEIDGHYTKKLHIPPLPCKRDGKLVFALYPIERECYTSMELRQAMDVGFVIDKVHRVHLWKEEECSRDLFTEYMTHFYGIKFTEGGIVAVLMDYATYRFNKNPSFWTDHHERKALLVKAMKCFKAIEDRDWKDTAEFCTQNRADLQVFFTCLTGRSTLEEAVDFVFCETVRANEESAGIRLDMSKLKMKKNTAKVETAKLFINSLWGQLGQDLTRRTESHFLTHGDEAKLWKMLNDKAIDCSIYPTTEDWIEVISSKKEGDIDQSEQGYEVDREDYCKLVDQTEETEKVSTCTAALVTAYGRCSLFEQMLSLDKALLMCDTDSTTYVQSESVSKERKNTGVGLGNYVSENKPLENEDTFLSIGPKFYAVKAGQKTTKFKAKGLRQKYAKREDLEGHMTKEELDQVKFTGDLLSATAMERVLRAWVENKQEHIEVKETTLVIKPKEIFSLEFKTSDKKAGINADKRSFYYNKETDSIMSEPLGWELFDRPDSVPPYIVFLSTLEPPAKKVTKRKTRPEESEPPRSAFDDEMDISQESFPSVEEEEVAAAMELGE